MATIIPLNTDNTGRRDGATALDRLTALVEPDLGLVNELIVRRMDSSVALIPQLAGHLIASGGKRLRPMLTLAAARRCGYSGARHRNLAACVEFIHTATLLHDDVVDISDMRRGEPSANALFGNSASVLVGDFLFSRAFQIMVEDGSLDVLRILSNASAVMAEGEVLQLSLSNDSNSSEQAYLDVVRAKTAELFAAACRIGAVIGGRPMVEEEALRTYGLNLGITFQIIDDVLDYAASLAKTGKAGGEDFRSGKMTLPVILAISRGSQAERNFWQRALESGEQRDGDFAHATELLIRHCALRDAVERARHYGAIARDALGIFPDSPLRKALTEIIDFVIARAG